MPGTGHHNREVQSGDTMSSAGEFHRAQLLIISGLALRRWSRQRGLRGQLQGEGLLPDQGMTLDRCLREMAADLPALLEDDDGALVQCAQRSR